MKGLGLRAQGLAKGLALAASALAVAVVSSQTPAPQTPQTPPPTFRTEANYVRVDVYPTKDDAPVADLTQADFEVHTFLEKLDKAKAMGAMALFGEAYPDQVRVVEIPRANAKAVLSRIRVTGANGVPKWRVEARGPGIAPPVVYGKAPANGTVRTRATGPLESGDQVRIELEAGGEWSFTVSDDRSL